MAGDWIKMRTSLLTNPRVNGIARELESSMEAGRVLSTGYSGCMSEIVTRNVMRHVTVSLLLVIWGAANEHTKDGIFHDADLSDIDDMAGIPGFGKAMESVGWIVFDEAEFTVTLPNFNEYNTSGSERSATGKSNAQRQKEYRDRKKDAKNVTENNVTRNVTRNRREEKRREDTEGDKSPSSRASRLPKTFDPSPEPEAEQGIDRQLELEKFHDFWAAKSGKDATKLDWQATWRNWARNAKRGPPSRAAPEPAWRTEERKRMQQAAPSVATKSPTNFFDLDAENVTSIGLDR